jgi:hypothetical protein
MEQAVQLQAQLFVRVDAAGLGDQGLECCPDAGIAAHLAARQRAGIAAQAGQMANNFAPQI